VATGHYAQLVTGEDGLIAMHRAVDMGKDQSYVLGVLTQEQLAHSLFPLGDSRSPTVRARREAAGSPVAQKPDSHDICFIADGDTGGWLRESWRPRLATAAIVDRDGEVLGSTTGATVHDRPAQGLRIGRRRRDGKPRYVLDIEPVSGTVTVGPARGARRRAPDRDQAAVVRHRARPRADVHGAAPAHGDEHRRS
jgi:tRNA-specific 2-thiouridylase